MAARTWGTQTLLFVERMPFLKRRGLHECSHTHTHTHTHVEFCVLHILTIVGSFHEMQGNQTSPLEYCQSAEPIKVEGLVVASTGSSDPSLGCPVEYISLKGTTKEKPAVCKYTGLKYYSDAWWKGGAH